MRKLTLITAIVLLLANVAWIQHSHAQWPQTTQKDLRFSAELGVKAYDRPGTDLLLPLISDGVTMATLFDSQQATDLGGAGGAEVKFNFVNPRNQTELELRMILADWTEDVTTVTGDNLVSPFFPVPGAEPTQVDYGYESDYFSIELMRRKAVAAGVTCMCGPRIISTRDQVNIIAQLEVDPLDGTPPVNVISTQSTEATNILLGLQAGFEFNFPITNDVRLQSFIRAGGYTNPTEVNTRDFTNFSAAEVQTRQSKSTGSFVGEIGVKLYADIIPQSLSTYVGYEATWIDGIAVAPAQLLTTGANGVETGNTIFFNAAVIGAQMRY